MSEQALMGRWDGAEQTRYMPRKLSSKLGLKLPNKAKRARVDNMKDFQVW